MIRRYLPLVLALHLAAPAVAAPEGQQTLFSFIKPTDVVKVESQAASFPELTAEPTPEGEVLRRYTADDAAPGGWGVVIAFGPGVSIEVLLVNRRCS